MNAKLHNTEDKAWWVKRGEEKEIEFVNRVLLALSIPAEINPDKKTSPFLPDLVVEGQIADLKYREIPFFTSYRKYSIPPQYAVTFNVKDFNYYYYNFPNIIIYFWVNWKTTTQKIGHSHFRVRPMYGVWRIGLAKMSKLIQEKRAPRHYYARRKDDMLGNAKSSYVFDLRDMDELFLKFPQEA